MFRNWMTVWTKTLTTFILGNYCYIILWGVLGYKLPTIKFYEKRVSTWGWKHLMHSHSFQKNLSLMKFLALWLREMFVKCVTYRHSLYWLISIFCFQTKQTSRNLSYLNLLGLLPDEKVKLVFTFYLWIYIIGRDNIQIRDILSGHLFYLNTY